MKIFQKAGLLTACILVFSFVIPVMPNALAANYTIGDGDQYIESKEELLAFLAGDKINRNPSTSNMYLTTDIDLEGATITPLRINEGTLDGQNHTISNYVIKTDVANKTTDSTYVGLIRFNRGTIKNLKIKDAVVEGNYVVGALVGANNGTDGKPAVIENVTAENVTITGHTDVGGLIGNNVATSDKATASITNCSVTGNIVVKGYSTCGSLIGFNRATLKNSFVTCNAVGFQVNATMESGAFAGENEGEIQNCYTNANVCTSKVESGGFIGDNDGKIYNCSSTGQSKGKKDVGGFVGSNTGTIKGCKSSGPAISDASGKAYVGGFVGLNDQGKIEKCSSTGDVTATGDTVGGFVGMNIKKTINTNCTVGTKNKKVIVKGGTDVGGFVGSHSGTRGLVKIENCKAYAEVTGKKNTGGFVGKNFGKNGLINKCHAYSKVKGKTNTGAFVGYNASGGRINSSKKNSSKVVGKKTKFAGKDRGTMKKCK